MSIKKAVVWLVIPVFAVLALHMSKRVKTLKVLVITSPSMSPRLPVGSLVIIQHYYPWEYKVGDIVTFKPPGSRTFVTHRVTAIVSRRDVLVVETKGDANTNGDPWYTAVGAVRGKVVLTIPRLGQWINTIQNSSILPIHQ